jgi:hypothetical protein
LLNNIIAMDIFISFFCCYPFLKHEKEKVIEAETKGIPEIVNKNDEKEIRVIENYL